MDAQATAVFFGFFADLPDPRRHNVRHLFSDILTIAILAVMSRADDWSEIVLYARSRETWLATFLSLPNGIPCEDTFRRVFARINPDAFEQCFIRWTTALAEAAGEAPEGRLIPIDGKTLCHSFLHAWNKQGLHLVSAWCQHNQIVLGQLAVEAKSNEITAIPKLLAMLNIRKAVVTIDAMGCQREIAGQIKSQGGDYVLAVKDNQPTLHEKVRKLLDEAVLDGFAGMSHGYDEQSNQGHGRIETRKVWVTDEVKWLGPELLALWPGLSSVARVESTRQDLGDMSGKISVERRYYIASLKGTDAGKMAGAIRGHWSVENKLHWRLDMAFREDDSRLRKDHSAENFSRLRRIAMNQLRKRPDKKISLKGQRFLCSLDPDYLLKRLQQ
jgi:predicted transposase YbfD/YdcC